MPGSFESSEVMQDGECDFGDQIADEFDVSGWQRLAGSPYCLC
jgi:hypothetical protein